MKVKRFEARDTKAALALVKEELGTDAVILSTRTLRGSKAGRSDSPRVEVVAAVDFDMASNGPSPAAETGRRFGYAAYAPPAEPPTQKKTGRQPSWQPVATAMPAPDDRVGSLEAEDLHRRFSDLLRLPHSDLPPERTAGAKQPIPFPAPKAGKPRPEDVAQWRDQLIGRLKAQPLTINRQKNGPTVIALVGPTGVGKTTTAAKIAAWFSIHEQCRVALLSMDCYRIGATDQLRTYARIMRLPCEVTLRPQDLAGALAKHRDKDLIIIDTAGKSPFDPGHVPELAAWFAAGHAIDTYLVVSATAKKEDLQQILNTYQPLKVNGLVVTKLDETRAYAVLCQQIAASSLPVSCLCTGQRVPEDFQPASKDFLRTLFCKGWQAAMQHTDTMAGREAWLQ
ncbi:MAG TPA: AAA family ATPase [Desulfurivibrionaceae bacterium]|nr:AAA family ATPase [Desulfurivibrionaceae bacterium]